MSSTFYIILVIAIVAILVLLISYIKAPPSVACACPFSNASTRCSSAK